MKSLILLVLLGLVLGGNWAVLICGNNGYGVYNHHADISHAYRLLRYGGFPPSHIVTFMYNDIPFHVNNPFPGEIFNKPGDNPPNVYQGVVPDYTGRNVTAEKFLQVLKGDPRAGGKILASKSDDNVFIFTVSIGAPYALTFEHGYVHAHELVETIQQMHDSFMYNKLVIFTEAGYAASMFKQLPTNISAYAVAATDDRSGSFWWYCSNSLVRGVDLGCCLGDLFSVTWMEYCDVPAQRRETLEAQFHRLVKDVVTNPVQRYGDLSFTNMTFSEFIGEYELPLWTFPPVPTLPGPTEKPLPESVTEPQAASRRALRDTANNAQTAAMSPLCDIQYSDARLKSLCNKAQATTGAIHQKWQKELDDELASRSAIDAYFKKLTTKSSYNDFPDRVLNPECYERGMNQFKEKVGWNEYGTKYFKILINICNENPNAFRKSGLRA